MNVALKAFASHAGRISLSFVNGVVTALVSNAGTSHAKLVAPYFVSIAATKK